MRLFSEVSREEVAAKMEGIEDRLAERVDMATSEDIRAAVDMMKLGLGFGEGEAVEAENLREVFSRRVRLLQCIIEEFR